MKAYQNQGPTKSPTAYDPNTSYRPNDYEDEPFDRNAPYRPQNDPYPQPPEPEDTTPTKKPANVTRRVAIGVGALALLGAAGFGAFRFGLVDALLGSNEPEPEPEPEQQPQELPTMVPAGTYLVGKDIDPGYWRANQFNPNGEFLKIFTQTNYVYTLKQPTTPDELAIWANQELWVRLEPGDQVQSGGTLTMMGREDAPASNSTKIPPMKSGLLFGGNDLTPGTWEVTPEEVKTFINVKGKKATKDDPEEIAPYTVMEANTTWRGRLLSVIAQRAKEEELSEKDIEERYRGVLILDPNDLADIDEPFLLANIDYVEGFALETAPTDATGDAATQTDQTTASQPVTQTENIQQQNNPGAKITPIDDSQTTQTTQEQAAPDTTQQQTQAPAANQPVANQPTANQPTANQPVANQPTQQTTTNSTQQQTTQTQQQPVDTTQQQPVDTTQQQTTDQTQQQQPVDQTQVTDPNQQQNVDATQQPQQQTGQYIDATNDPTKTLDTDLLLSMIEDNTAASRFEHVNTKSQFEIDTQTIILPILVSMRMSRVTEIPQSTTQEQPTEEQTEEQTQN